MPEMKSLTLNDKTYDSFVDPVARALAFASAMINSASGESLAVSDASDGKLYGLNIYGKTTQDGTPTPDAPVELVSVGEGGSITVSVSGENEGQSITVATPNGLPGIPVASGGNYTDAEGQQWVCDEVDLDRGVYVKRVGRYAINGNERMAQASAKWQKYGMYSFYLSNISPGSVDESGIIDRCLSTHAVANDWEWSRDNSGNNVGFKGDVIYLSFSNDVLGISTGDTDDERLAKAKTYITEEHTDGRPIVLYFILAIPVEAPLSEEELAAYSALHTYRDNTTVSNDASAHMKLEYVMDAKKYLNSLVASAILPATVE